MKKFFASLLNPKTKSQPENVQVVDPKKILFTVPTLSDELPPLDPTSSNPSNKDFAFHEDEWSQIEFFPKTQLKIVQQLLQEYKQFEQIHRSHGGWNDVYIRRIQRIPVLSAARPIARLEELLGIKADVAPILYTYDQISGRVKNGFSIPLGGNVTIYGYVENQDIPVLGADVGKNPDDFRLTDAFMRLNASDSLLLVDWRAQLLIIKASSDSEVETWRP